MKNEVNITNILKEFDEKFPRENDESISRFCRLDFFEGDSRSIKSFLQEQIRLVVESCPCEEELGVSIVDGQRITHGRSNESVKKWKESLLE